MTHDDPQPTLPFPDTGPRPATHLGAIVIGTLVTLGVQLVLGLLASSAGFAFRHPPTMGVVTGVLVAVIALVSAGLGGATTSALLRTRHPYVLELHSLATWALTVLCAAVITTSSLTSPLGSLVSVAGAGVVASQQAEDTGEDGELLALIKQINPVIVTDLELFKGRMVTTIETGDRATRLIDEVAKRTDTLLGEDGDGTVDKVANDVRQGVSLGALLGALALIATAGASVGAARFTARRLPPA